MTLNGANSTTSVNKILNFTGLGAVKVLCVNPQKDQLEELLSRKVNYDPDYSIRKSTLTGEDVRPLEFWVRNIKTGSVIRMNFDISTKLIESKTGKNIFINSIGQQSYFADNADVIINNEKLDSWYGKEGLRPLMVGEDKLFDFLQKLSCYSPKADGANWSEFTKTNGLTVEQLYEGNFKPLNDFIDYVNKMDINSIIVLHVVKEKLREDEETPRYYQEILTNPKTWFITRDGEVKDYMKESVKELAEEKEQQGYSLTSKYFSYDFMEFNDENKVKMANYTEAPAKTEGSSFTWG